MLINNLLRNKFKTTKINLVLIVIRIVSFNNFDYNYLFVVFFSQRIFSTQAKIASQALEFVFL